MKAMREHAIQPGSAIRADVIALYEEAFPPEERIEPGVLDELASAPGVEFVAYCDDGALCGFSYSIDTGNYLYLLFLAVAASRRSHGYGSRILGRMKDRYPRRTIVLEIEPVDPSADNAAQRQKRLEFYQRNGFSPAGFNSIEGDMTYTLLKTPGPFDAEACAREISCALKGLLPFKLVACPS